MKLSAVDTLYFYGKPSPPLLNELRHWLSQKKDRKVLILEDDPSALLWEERVESLLINSPQFLHKLEHFIWQRVFLSSDFHPQPGEGKDPTQMQLLFSALNRLERQASLLASDFSERGLNILKNILHNLDFLPRSHMARSLFGAYKEVPAIICGAGPSLQKEIPLLKQLKEKALIFAGGGSLKPLLEKELIPHFAGGVDPHPPKARLPHVLPENLPFFFQGRVAPDWLKKARGPLFWVEAHEHFSIEKEVARELKLPFDPFDCGNNVVTLLTSLAVRMGCNPIIFIGVELAQSFDRQKFLSEPANWQPLSTGENLYSKPDWLEAGQWLTQLAALHPEKTWINASSKGVPLSGMQTAPLNEIHFADIALPSLPSLSLLSVSTEKCKKELLDSFTKCAAHCDSLLHTMEKHFPNDLDKNADYILLKMELEKEKAFQTFLSPVWEVWKYVFERNPIPNTPPSYGIAINQCLFIKEICHALSS